MWFAIAKYRSGVCREVFMTWRFDAYIEEWHAARDAGFEIEVWCAETFKAIDLFRVRCQSRRLKT